jgi:hypothetical protein
MVYKDKFSMPFYIAQRLLPELPFHVLVLNLHDCTN